MSGSVLQVEGLRVDAIGVGEIVDDVSFEIGAGEIAGLVGESGSGKSTIGLAVLGHARRGARIVAGSVRIGADDLLTASKPRLRELRGGTVSYVAQDAGSALNPALRVREQVVEVLAAHGLGTSTRLDELRAETLLGEDDGLLRRYPHQLSGGQQQRVALAMAFACRPRVIVLDEPTTGLDVTTQARILEAVHRLCTDHGVAALYITHDLGVIDSVADRVLVLYAGQVVESAAKTELFEAPAHPYTRRLLESAPELTGRRALVGLPGGVPPPGRRPSGCAFAARCSEVAARCHDEAPRLEPLRRDRLVRCLRHRELEQWSIAERTAPHRQPNVDAESAVVAVSRLAADYGGQPVLSGIDLAVQTGHLVAIVGESGSGKTTLARCIVGLHRPSAGLVALRGSPLAPLARDRTTSQRRTIQYVFQSPYSSLNPRRSVAQLLEQPLRLFFALDRRASRHRLVTALERVRLAATLLPRFPYELSGGERQRVAIARALIAEPELLICDEVTSALDASVQAAIVELLAELQRETGVGLLFITHDLALGRAVADDVAVMSEGRIVETGTAEQVFGAPEHGRTKALLADALGRGERSSAAT